jgi:uncharacterized lipoprotein YmbA
MTTRRGAILLTVLLLAAGCGFLKRPPNQFYSLETIEGTVTDRVGAPLAVEGIQLPPGLDRRGIVLRGADHKFEVRGTHQWASDLEEMVMHTLAFDLANRLPEGRVILPGSAIPAGVRRSLYVVFEDLAPGPDNVFVLDARWTITEAGATDVVGHERIAIPMNGNASPQIVTAMSQALGQLADRVIGKL